MAKPTDNRADAGKPAGVLQQASAQPVTELLDELYALEEFRREQLILRKLGGYLKSTLTRREVYTAIESFGPQLWPDATGGVYFLHAAGEYLERVAGWGGASLMEASLAARDCWAMRRMQPHYVQEGDIELACGHVSAGALPSLCVPLTAQGQMLGLLHLQRLRKRPKTAVSSKSEHSAADLAVMAAEDVGIALSNIALRESLREQSIRDSLTGLFNRRFFEEFLFRELARAERKTQQLSVVVLDIDHFKRINDTFGHSAGDMVLRRVGPILQKHVRESDIACRIGGEEFLLLLSELTLPVAVDRAEEIRKALSQLSLTYEEKPLGAITASFGAAAYPDHGRTVDALFRAADEALLDAKRAGRNRVVSAPLRA